MTILACCPNCERRVRVDQNAAGRSVRCSGCQSTFIVKPGSGELLLEWGPIGAGTRIPLSPGQAVTIGRTKENAVCLPGALVSRHHATLTWVDSEWRLRDMGSTNGTFVNGQRVREIGLSNGSRIVIGDFALRLAVASTGPSDFEAALDAMALEESHAGSVAVVDAHGSRRIAVDTKAGTVVGQVALASAEQNAPVQTARRRGLFERWPVVVALVVIVVLLVVLLVLRLT